MPGWALDHFAPSDFTTAICAAIDTPSTMANDLTTPATGETLFYLVRARNDCPGDTGLGTSGQASSGAERAGSACP